MDTNANKELSLHLALQVSAAKVLATRWSENQHLRQK